jgi:hypothetical protein
MANEENFIFLPRANQEQHPSGADATSRAERESRFQFLIPPERPRQEITHTPTQVVEDVARSAAAGVGRGVVGMPGILGDIGTLADIGPPSLRYYARRPFESLGLAESGVAERTYNTAMEALRKSQSPEEREGTWNRIAGVSVPTSQYFVRGATPYVPFIGYEAQTTPGRIAGTLGEFVGGAPAGGLPGAAIRTARGTATAGRALGRAAGEAFSPATIAAGVGSGTAGETLGDTVGEGPSRIFGALAGAGGASAAARRLPGGVKERGEQVAGQLYRERLPEGSEATLTQPPEQYVPGATPTPGQLLGADGDQARALARRFSPEGTGLSEQQTRAALTESGREGLHAIEQAAPYQSMQEALNLPIGPNPMSSSSQAARSTFDAIHDALFQAKENAWSHPAISQARYNTADVNTAIGNALREMGDATYQNMPIELRRYVQNLQTFGIDGIPLEELQKVKQFANTIARNPNVMDRSGAIALTTHLDDIMSETRHVIPESMQGTDYTQAAPAWDAARNATRQYHQTFGTDYLRSAARTYPEGSPQAGMPVIPSANFLDNMLGSRNTALRNYNEIASLPNIDRAALDQSVGDWLVGKLTEDGRRLNFTEQQLDRFRASPQYRDIIQQIPGMSDRLDQIGAQTLNQRVRAEFSNALNSNDISRLSDFLRTHDAELRQILPQNQHQLIDQLSRSSELLRPLVTQPLTESRLLNFMQNGDLFSVLHGQALGLAPRFAAGTAAGYIASRFVPQLAGIEGVLGLGTGAGFLTAPTAFASRVFYGDVQKAAQEALSRAATDPQYLATLLRRPNPQDVFNPFSRSGWAHGLTEVAPNAAYYATLGVRAPAILQQQQPEPEQPRRLMQPRYQIPTIPDVNVTAPRPTRASGGRITSQHRAKAQALINAADRAKKAHNGNTKPILDMPDETVAKALSLADQAI